MSDLFKRHRPKLSEDEERALWERVRTIPREAGGRRAAGGERKRSPWEVLWARPAVRYGAPALAVALVAVVWVAQREPVPPARQNAARRAAPAPSAPAEERAQVESQDVPETGAPGPTSAGLPPSAATTRGPLPAPTPATTRSDRVAAGAEKEATTESRMLKAVDPANERLEQREAGGFNLEGGAREAAPAEEGGVGATSGSSTTGLATPPPAASTAPQARRERAVTQAEPQAVKDFYRENPRVGTIRAADEDQAKTDAGRVAALRAAAGSRTNAVVLGDRILVDVLLPSGSGTFQETVALPISGGVARITVDGTSARFVLADGDERAPAGARTTARSRAAALAVELILAVGTGDAGRVAQVRDAAHRLLVERPSDEAAREIASWSDDALAALASR